MSDSLTNNAQSISSTRFDAIVSAPFGAVGVRLTDDQQHVLMLTYLLEGEAEFRGKSALAKNAFKQITAYLKNAKNTFDLPTIEQGTAFQNKVWREISQIPRGDTLNYKFVGQLIGCGSPRAVGWACGANPYPLIIPCHRVVATNGIGGFARDDNGLHIEIKRWLLAHEGVIY